MSLEVVNSSSHQAMARPGMKEEAQ